jgi:hypothetical protein
MYKRYRRHLAYLLVGAFIGSTIFHVYTMGIDFFLVHKMDIYSWKNIIHVFSVTFSPEMFSMSVAFAFLGSLNGLFIAIIIDKKKRLYAAEAENEKKKVALETLQRLMITLSHYLLNANTVIAGMARHCLKCNSAEDMKDSIDIIEEQAKKIEAVIMAFKKITDIKIADYTSHGKGLMIDITQEIDEQLGKDKIQSS